VLRHIAAVWRDGVAAAASTRGCEGVRTSREPAPLLLSIGVMLDSRRGLAALAVGAFAFALGASGCATAGSARSMVATTAAASESSPTVPSGAAFRATLDAPLSSERAVVGDRFSATLDEPLCGRDGAPLVPAGAKLHGRVLDVAREGIHRLVLQFDTIEAGGRNRYIYAQVTRIESARVVASYATDATSVSVDVYPTVPRTYADPEIGGGPSPEQLPLELDVGAGIQLYLSRPLILEAKGFAAP
jgi:hypothetical protein